MTDQLPDRTPPWGLGVWSSAPRPQVQPVRIGDAERDEALDRLGDHFAAGRLSREEFDERSDTAMGARFDTDLAPLFADLPGRPNQAVARRSRPSGRVAIPPAVLLLVPLLVLVVVVSVAAHGAFFFAPLIWLFVLSGGGRRFRHHH